MPFIFSPHVILGTVQIVIVKRCVLLCGFDCLFLTNVKLKMYIYNPASLTAVICTIPPVQFRNHQFWKNYKRLKIRFGGQLCHLVWCFSIRPNNFLVFEIPVVDYH